MNNYELRLRHIIDYYSLLFLKDSNIIGIGYGNKKINNKETKTLSLKIFVRKKIHENCMPAKLLVPKSFFGTLTDVEEFGDINLLSGEERPASGGLSIGIKYGAKYKSGTIGYAVTDKYSQENTYFLTCNHCVTPFGLGTKGTPVYQPSLEFGGKERVSQIGELSKAIPIKIGMPKDGREFNEVDAAVVAVGKTTPKLLKDTLAPRFKDGVVLVGIKDVGREDVIHMQGASSGKISGKVISEKTTFKSTMPYGPDSVTDIVFKDQIICEVSVNSSDSGALAYLEEERKAIGMLWAGSDKKDRNLGVFNKIDRVLDLLNVELITPFTYPIN